MRSVRSAITLCASVAFSAGCGPDPEVLQREREQAQAALRAQEVVEHLAALTQPDRVIYQPPVDLARPAADTARPAPAR
jgi:hypothetical protein